MKVFPTPPVPSAIDCPLCHLSLFAGSTFGLVYHDIVTYENSPVPDLISHPVSKGVTGLPSKNAVD